MLYIYPAVFSPIAGSEMFYAQVPDIEGCVATGHSLPAAIESISDTLAGFLMDFEDDDTLAPDPTAQAKIEHAEDDVLSMVMVDTTLYRKRANLRIVRKTVALPAWLDDLAKREKLNYSTFLQRELIRYLVNFRY